MINRVSSNSRDFTNESDIDIVVDFSKPIGIEFIGMANEIESIHNRKVDLVSKAGIKPGYLLKLNPKLFISDHV